MSRALPLVSRMNVEEITKEIEQCVKNSKDPVRRRYAQWYIGIGNDMKEWKKHHSKEKNTDNWREWPAGKSKGVANAVKMRFLSRGMKSGGDRASAFETVYIYIF